MRCVMVVEDDKSVAQLLACLLEAEGFRPVISGSGSGALEALGTTDPDLILLDLGLPGLPGTEVLRQVRQICDVPVIIVSGKDDEIERIVGLEMGADDYVAKPFSPRELVARIRAVLRRDRQSPSPGSLLTAGPVHMDVDKHIVLIRGVPVRLPLKEFELLQVLVRNTGLVVTRMRLIDMVWGTDYVGDTKTLDVHIRRLRAKVEEPGPEPRHIITIRGLGYRFQTA